MAVTRDEFFKLRIERVLQEASLYELMTDVGFEPRSDQRAMQLHCHFISSHAKGKDVKPSARYYPPGERDEDHGTYHCFVCTDRPLDAIGWTMRINGWGFMDAMRHLERRYRIKYDDVDVVDGKEELRRLSQKKTTPVDPTRLLDYCEKYLREHKRAFGLKRYSRLSYALDVIYHRDDEKQPAQTTTRLEKWKSAARRIVEGAQSAEGT